MTHVVNTDQLLADGWLTPPQVAEIARRSRETMIALVVNIVLFAGIVAASLGLVFWLADAAAVAITGGVFLAAGVALLLTKAETYRMIANAAALIGASMLVVGGAFELLDTFRDVAGPILLGLGAVLAAISGAVFRFGPAVLRLSTGAVMLLGLGAHLTGAYFLADMLDAPGVAMALLHGFTTAVVIAAGIFLNVRAVTALAILPFAQMLDAGTAYFHAAYVFYSPEPTLTILQMGAAVVLCAWLSGRLVDRLARHTGILAILAGVVGNLAFLVGSLWGDNVGETFAQRPARDGADWSTYSQILTTWRDGFLHIHEHVFAVGWAVLLLAAALWAAHHARRGLFNLAVTFGAIHAYTQLFETMDDAPLAFAIAGITAVPVAWGIWRWNMTRLQSA